MSASDSNPHVNSIVGNVVGSDAAKDFGANEWLVDEMYERYLSFSDDTESILNEAIKYNGKVIL